jgi:hypothetical protein
MLEVLGSVSSTEKQKQKTYHKAIITKRVWCCPKNQCKPVPVTHTYNPSYSGGRDQEEDGGSKSALGQIVRETLS